MTLVFLILFACDPILEVQADVSVPATIQSDLHEYPYELVLHTTFDGQLIHERLAVLCEADLAVDVTWYDQGIGCGEPTVVEAWLTPLSSDAEECGLAVEGTPATTVQVWPGDTPYIQRTAFNEANGKCNQSYRDHLEMTLEEP